jgi:hypothetical protein
MLPPLATGDGVGFVELSLLCGTTSPLLMICFGKNANTEINKTAAIATTVKHFAFLLNRQCLSWKKPFFDAALRETSMETSQIFGREQIFLSLTEVFVMP